MQLSSAFLGALLYLDSCPPVIRHSHLASLPLRISFGIMATNYGTTENMTWADGDATSKSFTVPIQQDGTLEGDETLTVNLPVSVGNAGSTGLIRNERLERKDIKY